VDISIFIPVYKESTQLGNMINKLSSQSVAKEIFVTVDEPSKNFLESIENFSEKAKVIVNKERVGKANALNSTVPLSSGKALLFLDADVEVPDDPDFLKKIVMELEHVDVLDIKKKVTRDNSFLSRMAYYEYFTFNISAWLSSKCLHKCPAVNGAAFAMKREMFKKVNGFRKVVAEDIDIATRAFLDEGSFAYTSDVEVRNVVYSDWRKWFTQRRRWSVGQALWLKEWWRELGKRFLKKPQVFLPSLFFLYPSVAIFLVSVLVPSIWLYNSLLVFSLFLSVKFNLVLPIFLVSLATADILKILLISFSSFGITAAIFYGFSRKMGFEMKIHELFAYYFFYANIWMAIIIIGHIQVFLGGKRTPADWKI
jgi:cellulose synthase/poly-beta-1,6-N-acetylglucosamine synthase-like glycosyltransferase